MAFQLKTLEQIASKTLHFLQELLGDYHPRDFEIELWDGTRWEPETSQFRRFTWKITNPFAVRRAFSGTNELALAEAYLRGDFDIDGDIEGVFPLADFLVENLGKLQKLRLGAMLLELPAYEHSSYGQNSAKLRGRPHSKERDRQAVRYHYDVSNDFYRLWLDKNMVYSCAYFESAKDDLDTAQIQKLDYVCRKLRLQAGERLLDIGCGWGGLILHAVCNYGVNALGITLSQRQFDLATERIRKAGLADRCQVRLVDYRDLDEPSSFDKISSVGMVEHVGEAKLEEYFGCVYRLLKPGGVFLNHGIGVPESRYKPKGPTFVDLYVFPDGELLPISVTTRSAEKAGFEVRDVENLREHYALTLSHWVQNMTENAHEACHAADEMIYRIWRLQMAGSAHYFRKGKLDLYQTLLVKSKNGCCELPLTRADWY
jgi:cyclopropane-fatty-acyl-phospholipid synthase